MITLTRMLAPSFQTIIAVDKNQAVERALSRIPNTSLIIARMEDVSPPHKMDIILLSYSLQDVPDALRGPLLRSLFEHLTPRGQILLATHQDGCPWDVFLDHVSGVLGLTRSGGATRHRDEIRDVGLDLEPVVVFDTFIWADDLDSLFDTLEFFFLERSAAYRASRGAFTGVLRSMAEPLPGGRVGIRVTEGLLRVVQKHVMAG